MTKETLRLLDLPWDLVVEIISRVPATCLSRLRFTCKRWNALIKDEEFIKKHLDKTAKQHMVLMLRDFMFYSMHVNLHDMFVDPQTSLVNLKSFNNSERFGFRKIFHCDGLLLCHNGSRITLVVWNPCTGQIRRVQLSDYKCNTEFFLGYENNKSCRQTYKILRYSWVYRDNFHHPVVECGIYDFGSCSWRDLDDIPPKCNSITSKGVSLKGNAYWTVAKDKEEDVLLSFDFSTERFWALSIPFASIGIDCRLTALSVVREERLAVLYNMRFTGHPPKIEIWMTTDDKIDQTKVVSWSKFLSLELDENNPQKGLSSVTSFFIDEEKKAAVLCGLEYRNKRNMVTNVYIVGEDNLVMKIPVGEYRLQFLRPAIYNYVPSLARIQERGVMTRKRKRKNRH
ncbi:putative F-box protein At3g17500 [Raphanus sativus]|uniref:F-box protein At3g17500 n=1 Tax=Raphanus sativus TaxID=3726 RepID=A0A6J0P3K0_RAPSA|nr:putative F-box protein At3g17500 [Raphanus sativus]